MFGEETLAFTKKIDIKSKNRITIPAETKIEQGDRVTFYKKDHHLMLCNYKDLSNYLKKLKVLSDNAFRKGDLKLKTMYDYEIKLISASIYKTYEVNEGKNRIFLQDEMIDDFGFEDSIYMSGILNTAIIFKDLEDKEDYIKGLYIGKK